MFGWTLLIAAVIGLVLAVKLVVRTVQGSRGPVRTGRERQDRGGQERGGQEQGGKTVNYYANTRHRQRDNWFQFQYKKVGNVWRIYILRMPSLAGRDGNLHLTHRHSGGGRYWICYDPEPRTLKDAYAITRAWADRELEYITTGTPFENQRW